MTTGPGPLTSTAMTFSTPDARVFLVVWVALRAVCLAGLVDPAAPPPLGVPVDHVVALGADAEVVVAEASRVVAEVHHDLALECFPPVNLSYDPAMNVDPLLVDLADAVPPSGGGPPPNSARRP